MFLFELDTTKDIMTQNQCSIVLRYVYEGVVHETVAVAGQSNVNDW